MPYTATRDPVRTGPYDRFSVQPNRAVAITPNDGADLPTYINCITAQVEGLAVVVPMMQEDETAVTIYVPSSGWKGMFIRKILATGTTATGLVGGTN